MSFKKCSSCKEIKELGSFHRCLSKPDGRQSACKECQLEMSRSSENRRRAYKAKLRREYNLDFEDYVKLLEQQGNLCCVCRLDKELQIDHDHKSGRIRGLLCRDCNVAIGFMKDNPIILRKAADYLENV